MSNVARFLKSHTAANTANDYTPAFTDTNPTGPTPSGSVGIWTPLYFGVHNPSADQDVIIWTVDQQGLTGNGITVHMLKGSTFYARIAKLQVTNPVVLLGTANSQGVV